MLYNANNSRDRQTLALANTLTSRINKQEINSVVISGTMFRLMVDGLGMDAKKLLNKADREYQRLHRGSEIKPALWLEAIKRRPELLRAPVAMYRGKVVICDTPTAIFKLATPNSRPA